MMEKLQIWCAWSLPKWLVAWAIVRMVAHATTGKYQLTELPRLTCCEALERWETEYGSLSLTFIKEHYHGKKSNENFSGCVCDVRRRV